MGDVVPGVLKRKRIAAPVSRKKVCTRTKEGGCIIHKLSVVGCTLSDDDVDEVEILPKVQEAKKVRFRPPPRPVEKGPDVLPKQDFLPEKNIPKRQRNGSWYYVDPDLLRWCAFRLHLKDEGLDGTTIAVDPNLVFKTSKVFEAALTDENCRSVIVKGFSEEVVRSALFLVEDLLDKKVETILDVSIETKAATTSSEFRKWIKMYEFAHYYDFSDLLVHLKNVMEPAKISSMQPLLDLWKAKVPPDVVSECKLQLAQKFREPLAQEFASELNLTIMQRSILQIFTDPNDWSTNFDAICVHAPKIGAGDWSGIIEENLETKLPRNRETWSSFVFKTYEQAQQHPTRYSIETGRWKELVDLFGGMLFVKSNASESQRVLAMFTSRNK